jgi:hypothetical protein
MYQAFETRSKFREGTRERQTSDSMQGLSELEFRTVDLTYLTALLLR